MENNNFEKQFKSSIDNATLDSNIHKPVAPNLYNAKKDDSSKLPWIVSIVLAIIILIESIALAIVLVNYFNIVNAEDAEWAPEASEEDTSLENNTNDENFIYDDDYYLTAANLKCTNDDGAMIVLDTSNNFKRYDNASALIDSGNYSIKDDGLISVTSNGSDNGKVFYYNYASIADGLTIYNCEEDNTEE